MKIQLILSLIITGICCSGCIEVKNEFQGLPPGTWRAELRIGKNPFPVYDEKSVRDRGARDFQKIKDDRLPFLMKISYPTRDSFVIDIMNGEEKIRVQDYEFGWDRSIAKDTLLIRFPEYNSFIRGTFVESKIQGEFVDHNRKNYSIPFVAEHGHQRRFPEVLAPPGGNVEGQWDVTFTDPDGSEWSAIGEFEQDSLQVSGTFLTKTGDYRFLEGVMVDERLWLSTFDGSHAYLFGAQLVNPDSLKGFFKSGNHYNATWTAKRTSAPQLPSPDSLTRVIAPEKMSAIKGLDSESRSIHSLSDPEYEDVPVLLSIMGTWCPNCKDEAIFLRNYLQEHPEAPFKVIGLAFEKYPDTSQALKAIQQYKRLLNLPYEIWYMGDADKESASQALPMLNQVISYPTLIFLDSNQQVKRIHTGFAGPATSKFEEFKESFHQTIQSLE